MSQITLKLWVSNQVGCDSDCTDSYILGAGWRAPAGVALDADAQTLTGEPEAVWAAYRSLAAAVADMGHGVDMDGDEIPGTPALTACPTDLICGGYTCAAHALARVESRRCETWAGFVAAVPALS